MGEPTKHLGPVSTFIAMIVVLLAIAGVSYGVWRLGKWVNYKIVYSDFVAKELEPLKSNDAVQTACIKELKRQVDDLQARVKKLEEKK